MSAAAATSKRREWRRFRPRPKPNVGGEDGNEPQQQSSTGTTSAVKPSRTKKPPRCRYFATENGCRLGDECRFRHVASEQGRSTTTETADPGIALLRISHTPSNRPAAEASLPEQPIVQKRVAFRSDEESHPERVALRSTAVAYWKRRLAKSKQVNDGEDGNDTVTGLYHILQPDWPFDVRQLWLSVTIPTQYPIKGCTIVLASESDDSMPSVLSDYLNGQLKSATEKLVEEQTQSDLFSCSARSLVRTIDKNILTWFVDGLRRTRQLFDAHRAGIRLVDTSSRPNDNGQHMNESVEQKTEPEPMALVQEDKPEPVTLVPEDEPNGDEETATQAEPSAVPSASLVGAQPSVTYPLEAYANWSNKSANIASLAATLISVVVKCGRCSKETEKELSLNEKTTAWRCEQCKAANSLCARAELIHEFSPVLAKFSAKGCRPLDCNLLKSRFRFTCLQCNREADVQSLNYGVEHKSWCHACHAPCQFVIHSIRFRGDFAACSLEDKTAAASLPKARAPKTTVPQIQAGGPLPDQGTCKHYRKSFRWFRFPCCGRVYPCDVCHEEATTDGHEMKLANRVVCGFCSLEQPFQKDRSCAGCNEQTSKPRSVHWEGGKGCRDQTRMSRNDPHKFSNSRMKTVAKKRTGQLVVKKSDKTEN